MMSYISDSAHISSNEHEFVSNFPLVLPFFCVKIQLETFSVSIINVMMSCRSHKHRPRAAPPPPRCVLRVTMLSYALTNTSCLITEDIRERY